MTPKILVGGGGIVGLAAAYALVAADNGHGFEFGAPTGREAVADLLRDFGRRARLNEKGGHRARLHCQVFRRVQMTVTLAPFSMRL